MNCWKLDPGEASSWGFVGSAWWRTIRMHVNSMDQGLTVSHGLWYVYVKSQDPFTTRVGTEDPKTLVISLRASCQRARVAHPRSIT